MPKVLRQQITRLIQRRGSRWAGIRRCRLQCAKQKSTTGSRRRVNCAMGECIAKNKTPDVRRIGVLALSNPSLTTPNPPLSASDFCTSLNTIMQVSRRGSHIWKSSVPNVEHGILSRNKENPGQPRQNEPRPDYPCVKCGHILVPGSGSRNTTLDYDVRLIDSECG